MNLKTRFDWAKYLTILRLWNMIQLRLSFLISLYFKKVKLWGKPFAISVEPTTSCNLGCPECPSGLKQFSRPTGKLSLENNLLILNQLKGKLQHINYYFQGEPFIHGQFLDLVKQAKEHNIYVSTSTNAHFITTENAKEIMESGLDQLIISLDGTTQETYEKYRVHGKLEKVLESCRMLVEAKKRAGKGPQLVFQFLVVAPNEHQIENILQLAKEMQIDEVRFKTAQLYDYENGNDLMPKNEKYSRYVLDKNGKFKLKYSITNKCWRMWSSCVFTWDLRVVPCCFDKDASYVLGNLNASTSFESIWRGKKYQDFRKQLFSDRTKIAICTNCSEGSKVLIET
jgi:radical SAM protein with 4Fe4S-binding SPASM domain